MVIRENIRVNTGMLLRDTQPDAIKLVAPAMGDADNTRFHLITDGDLDTDTAHP